MSKGLFISFEGNDGSGKTSILNALKEKLQKEGIEIILTREPGGNKIAEQIRSVILDKENTDMDSRTEALLYAAARRQHLVQNVHPLLNQGKIVISDRYIDSSLAYQGFARDIGIDNVYNLNMFATENTLPDLTILFDITPELGITRINANRSREVNRLDLEVSSFHKKVYEGYKIVASKYPSRIKVIDASKPFDEVLANVYSIIKETIKNNKD